METFSAQAPHSTHHAPNGRDVPPAGGRLRNSLVAGILSDAEALLKDHADLARAEAKAAFAEARAVSYVAGAAGALGFLGALFLLTAIAVWLNVRLASPWAGFGIVAALVLVAAAACYAGGRAKFRAYRKAPTLPQTKEAIREDVTWISTTLRRT